jgi:hypothetical protein
LVWHSRLLDLDDAARWRGDHPRAVRVVEVGVRVQRGAEKTRISQIMSFVYVQNTFFENVSKIYKGDRALTPVVLDFFFRCT